MSVQSSVELVVGAFPGQGAYFPGCLDAGAGDTGAGDTGAAVLDEVDEVVTRMLGRGLAETVLLAEPPSLDRLLVEAPDHLQVAVFASSLLVFEALRANGGTFAVLIGHSLGEIAALTAAGAFSVADGAEVLCHRIMALREHDTSGGGMVALGCDADRAGQLLALLSDPTAVLAVDNGPRQVSVSGPADALRRVTAIAGAIGVSARPLAAPHPFHGPLLAGARETLTARLSGYRSRGLRMPVFSPILGRFYRDTDDLGALLASQLTRPVQFAGAVRRLTAAGARVWVEGGAGRTVTCLATTVEPDLLALTPLTAHADTVRETAAYLTPVFATGPRDAPEAPAAVERTAPQPVAAEPVAPQPVAAVPTRAEIAGQVRALYAAALEYPEEVFEDTAELEAELGVDSVKQTELIVRVGELFQLGPQPADLPVARLRTFGGVVDFVRDAIPAARAVR